MYCRYAFIPLTHSSNNIFLISLIFIFPSAPCETLRSSTLVQLVFLLVAYVADLLVLYRLLIYVDVYIH